MDGEISPRASFTAMRQCWRQGLCPSDERTINSLGPLWIRIYADNVNTDVPSRLKWMASFSKSVNARRKWIVTSELVSLFS